MKTIINIIIAIFLFIAFALILNKGIEKTEIAECYKWQAQSEQLINWYSTDWQKAQCNHYGIEIK